jgi:hypothetical protein
MLDSFLQFPVPQSEFELHGFPMSPHPDVPPCSRYAVKKGIPDGHVSTAHFTAASELMMGSEYFMRQP